MEVGDIVLLVDKFTKAINYPMGIVTQVELNSLKEVTAAMVKKGNGEVVYRHVTSLILLLPNSIADEGGSADSDKMLDSNTVELAPMQNKRQTRRAAMENAEMRRELIRNNLL